MPDQLTRRGLLAGAGALGLGAALAACGTRPATPSSRGGSWSFTDDRGTRVRTAGRPDRIVAYIGTAAALYDFGVTSQIVGVFGPTKLGNGKPDVAAGNIDIGKVTIIGNTYGEFDVEKYAALRPQLLITEMYENQELWFVPARSSRQITALAPTAALTASHVALPKPLQRHADLAAALGAPVTAPAVVAAKKRFDSASDGLRKARRGIRVLAGSASADLFYVSDPRVYADLSYFRELGVDLIVPDNVTGGFFENLSWENVGKYPADVIMLDSRTAALQPADLSGKPTWAALPAVRAGQVTPWLSEPRFSYQGVAPAIENLTGVLNRAGKVG